MKKLREIDDLFIDEYILAHRNKLSKPIMGGTDWRFADIVAPAFREVLKITGASSILEIGFNIGGSALMFLSINTELVYHSIDINKAKKSVDYMRNMFEHFDFYQLDSKNIFPCKDNLRAEYDLIFIDGDHSITGAVNDIENSLYFKPKYLLIDDYRHPSHSYIEKMVTDFYDMTLEVIKVFEFNQCWQGYSMALCKVK